MTNFQFYSKLTKFEIDQLINQLSGANPLWKADVCKELITHVDKLYRKFNENNGQLNSATTVNITQEILDSTKKAQRKRKDLAAQKRAKIIAQMTELQKNFIEKNIQLCSDTMDEHQSSIPESASPTISSPDQQILCTSLKSEAMIVDDCDPVIQPCLGMNDIELFPPIKQILTCIFCQENSEVKLNSEALVLSAYIQKFV